MNVMTHTCNPSTQEAETGGSRIRAQTGLHIRDPVRRGGRGRKKERRERRRQNQLFP
jgi:hypothetical protein